MGHIIHRRLVSASIAHTGRDVTDVTGTDVPAFAAEWIQADRSHPGLDAALRFAAVLSLTSGALALLEPTARGVDGVGLTAGSLVLVAVASFAVLLVDIGRMYRDRLDRSAVMILGIVGLAVAGALGALAGSRSDGQVIADLPPVVAALLLVIGTACSFVSWKLRRTRRTTSA